MQQLAVRHLSVAAAIRWKRFRIDCSPALVEAGDKGLGAVLHVVWGSDFDLHMWGAGAAGVAGCHELLSCCDVVAGGGEMFAVAVHPLSRQLWARFGWWCCLLGEKGTLSQSGDPDAGT